jgi:hypothetical protein
VGLSGFRDAAARGYPSRLRCGDRRSSASSGLILAEATMTGERVSRRTLSAVVVLLTACGVVLVARPAAAVPGQLFVTATSATDSNETKGLYAKCPSGLAPIGGGAEVTGGANRVRISHSVPMINDAWSVSAMEDNNGYAGDWSITAWAICAPKPAGYQVVWSTTTAPAGETYGYAIASCPRGSKVIGAGGTIGQPADYSVLATIAPSPNLTNVLAEAFADPFYAQPYPLEVSAVAICVDPLPSQQLVTHATPWTSGDKQVTAWCPPATIVHGLGASIVGANGQAILSRIVPGRVTVEVAALEDYNGYQSNWVVYAFAICASG